MFSSVCKISILRTLDAGFPIQGVPKLAYQLLRVYSKLSNNAKNSSKRSLKNAF